MVDTNARDIGTPTLHAPLFSAPWTWRQLSVRVDQGVMQQMILGDGVGVGRECFRRLVDGRRVGDSGTPTPRGGGVV
jgi:hypothetical protein